VLFHMVVFTYGPRVSVLLTQTLGLLLGGHVKFGSKTKNNQYTGNRD